MEEIPLVPTLVGNGVLPAVASLSFEERASGRLAVVLLQQIQGGGGFVGGSGREHGRSGFLLQQPLR